jgi:hypothetical protein
MISLSFLLGGFLIYLFFQRVRMVDRRGPTAPIKNNQLIIFTGDFNLPLCSTLVGVTGGARGLTTSIKND